MLVIERSSCILLIRTLMIPRYLRVLAVSSDTPPREPTMVVIRVIELPSLAFWTLFTFSLLSFWKQQTYQLVISDRPDNEPVVFDSIVNQVLAGFVSVFQDA